MAKNKVTADNLKNVLWQTIGEVRKGKTNTQKANAICANARGICAIVKIELAMAKLIGIKPTAKSQEFING